MQLKEKNFFFCLNYFVFEFIFHYKKIVFNNYLKFFLFSIFIINTYYFILFKNIKLYLILLFYLKIFNEFYSSFIITKFLHY